MTKSNRPEATFDRDGYPTEESIDAILTYEGTPAEFVFFTQRLYRNGAVEIEAAEDDFGHPIFRVSYVTLGWSGCESVMGAIKQTMFMHFWRESKVGGLDVFEVKRSEWTADSGFWGDFRRRGGATALQGEASDRRVEVAHTRKRGLLLAANLIQDAVDGGESVSSAAEGVRDRAYAEIIAFADAADAEPRGDLADDLTARLAALCRLLEKSGDLTPTGTRQIKSALADSIAKH